MITTKEELIEIAWEQLEKERPLASDVVVASPPVLCSELVSALLGNSHLPPREYFEASAMMLMILLHCDFEEELS